MGDHFGLFLLLPSLPLNRVGPGLADRVVLVELLTPRFSEVNCLDSVPSEEKTGAKMDVLFNRGQLSSGCFQLLSLVYPP